MSRLETLIALQENKTQAPIPVRIYRLWEHQHVANDTRPELLKTALDNYLQVDIDWFSRGMPSVANKLKAALKEDDVRIDEELVRRSEERQCQVESNLQLAARVANLANESIDALPKSIKRHLQVNIHGWEMWEGGSLQTPNYLDLLLADGDRLNELLAEYEEESKKR